MVRFREDRGKTSVDIVGGGLTSIVTRIFGDEGRKGDTVHC